MEGQCSIAKKETLPKDACILLSEYKAMISKYWEPDPCLRKWKKLFQKCNGKELHSLLLR